MKTRTTLVILAVGFAAAAVCFGATKPAPAAAASKAKATTAVAAATSDPQMGTWKLNEAKSKLAPGSDKNMTVVYAAAGDKVKVTVDGVDKNGKATHNVWTGKFDGKSYAVKGDKASDARAYTMANDRTLDMTVTKGGKVTATGKIEVAKDGKSRVVTISGTDASGKKFKSKAAYDKQ